MIERVYQSSIPQDDLRRDSSPSRRRPRRHTAEPVEEPEDTLILSSDGDSAEQTEDDLAI